MNRKISEKKKLKKSQLWTSLFLKKAADLKNKDHIKNNAKKLSKILNVWLFKHQDMKVRVEDNDEWSPHGFWITRAKKFNRSDVIYFSWSKK